MRRRSLFFTVGLGISILSVLIYRFSSRVERENRSVSRLIQKGERLKGFSIAQQVLRSRIPQAKLVAVSREVEKRIIDNHQGLVTIQSEIDTNKGKLNQLNADLVSHQARMEHLKDMESNLSAKKK